MSGLIGKKLSHYRVVRRIGEGGMGVVYQARDVRLERDVALKILVADMLRSEDARKRFRREARTLSALNHRNIATVYDFDTQGQVDFLVMELIYASTLREKLAKGPIPGVEAIGMGLQIAAALEFAHGRGIIHRDLKPGNIMVTPGGVLKVLDFGLARTREAAAEPVVRRRSSRASAVQPVHASQAMGTPGYMSPEQIVGQSQDHRTDIFAFGCVLFECLAGVRAFEGETAEDVLAAVLESEPRWAALPKRVPHKIRNLLARCLEKDQLHRLPQVSEIRLELEAIRGARSLALSSAGTSTSATPHNLPGHDTSFIGREAETEECVALLSENGLLTLTGAGGCGKTRLALRVAEEALGDFPDGAWFVDLAPIREGARVVPAVASAASVREEPGIPMSDTLPKALRDSKTLLVLDNCENCLSACADIAHAIIRNCPNVRILATSREALKIPGERALVVPPLRVPANEDAAPYESFASIESIRLFCERAVRAKPTFKVSRESVHPVAEICRRLDGIPLAIELAASLVAALTPEEIRSRLDQRFRLLTAGSPEGPARHQTLAAAIRWSYEELAPEERRMFRGLSVFAGGWTFESARVIHGGDQDEFAVLDLFTRLLDKSLMVEEATGDGVPRYRYLETIRAYALEELERSAEVDAARARHLDHFLSLAEEAAPKLIGPEQAAWLTRLGAEHENLLEAIRWGGQSGDVEKALRMIAAIWRFWIARGHLAVGRRALEEVLNAKGESSRSEPRGVALLAGGAIAFQQGDLVAAQSYCERSLGILSEVGSPGAVADTLVGLGNAALGRGDYASARSSYDQAMLKYAEVGNDRGLGVALSNAGRVAELQGDFAAASDLYERGLGIIRGWGDLASAALRLSSLAHVSLKLGDRKRARDLLVECLTLVQELKEKRSAPHGLERSAALFEALGDTREAAVLLAASDALREQLGSPLTPRERIERDDLFERLREDLDEKLFQKAWAEGRALRFEQAVRHALTSLSRVDPNRTAAPRHREGAADRESTRALLQEVRVGDSAAIARLVKRYLPILRRWAHGRLPSKARDMADTDDLVQVALIRGLGHVQNFEERGTGAFFAYMRQILRNQIRDEIRKPRGRAKFEELPEDLPDGGASPLEEAIGKESLDRYEAALATLPKKQREAVVMRLEMGFSYREIAEALGSPSEEAARISIRRALERIRRQMPGSNPSEA